MLTVIAAAALSLLNDPAASRPASSRIEVRWAHHATIWPEDGIDALIGTPTDGDGVLFPNEDGLLSWRVDRLTRYTVTVYFPNPDPDAEPDFLAADWFFPVLREYRLDEAAWFIEEGMRVMFEVEQATFHEYQAARERVRAEMSGDPPPED